MGIEPTPRLKNGTPDLKSGGHTSTLTLPLFRINSLRIRFFQNRTRIVQVSQKSHRKYHETLL